MKKAITWLLVSLMLLGTAVACGGSNKTAITKADFVKAAQENGLTVEDANDTYTDAIFTDAQLATHPDGWNIVFFTIDTPENAHAYFSTVKAYLESLKTGAGSAQTTERDTWGTYTQTNGGKFGYVTQIDGTMLYTFADEAHKDAISAFAKSIGY